MTNLMDQQVEHELYSISEFNETRNELISLLKKELKWYEQMKYEDEADFEFMIDDFCDNLTAARDDNIQDRY